MQQRYHCITGMKFRASWTSIISDKNGLAILSADIGAIRSRKDTEVGRLRGSVDATALTAYGALIERTSMCS